MTVSIIDANTISVTGGSVGAPLDLLHIVTLANWPTGTTQATVDSYITRTSGSYTFNIPAGKRIIVGSASSPGTAGYLSISDATIVCQGIGSFICAGYAGVITGGVYVSGKVFKRPTIISLLGFLGGNGGSSILGNSLLFGSGQLNCTGLRIIMNSQQPGATAGHTAVIIAADTGSFTLPDLELLCEGNSPCYLTLNANVAGSSASIKEIRCGAIRHSSTNVTLSFGDGGWVGGDNGTAKPKFLVPAGAVNYIGFAPIFQSSTVDANNILNVTNLNFATPDVTFQDSYVDVGRITLYPNAWTNSVKVNRTLKFNPTAPDGSSLTNFTARVTTTSGFEKVNAKFNTGGSQVVQVWRGLGAIGGSGDGTYLLPSTVFDDRSLSVLFRHPSRNESTVTTSGELGAVNLQTELGLDSAYTADGSLVTGVTATATRLVTSNLLTYSEQFDNTVWSKNVCNISANNTTDPLGGNTADKLTSTGGMYLYEMFSAKANTQYTFSLYVKSVTAGVTVHVAIHDPSATEIAGTNIVTTGAWQRVSITATSPSTARTLWANISGLTNGQSAYIWGAQLEESPSIGSYVSTTSSALYQSTVTAVAFSIVAGAAVSYDQFYNFAKYWLCQPAQMDVPNVLSVSGKSLTLSSICSLTVGTGATLSEGAAISYLYAPSVTNNGKITGLYGYALGNSSRIKFSL